VWNAKARSANSPTRSVPHRGNSRCTFASRKGVKQPAHVAELLRTAMVLLVDHELTSSAFAARITASTGASLPGCLLGELATLSGPLHGDASGRVKAPFDEVER